MLEMRLTGRVERYPEGKVSAKGVNYCRVTVEVKPERSQYSKKINLTGFGDVARGMERHLTVGDTVEVVCEPQARGYADKLGKPAAVLEGIVRSVKVLSTPQPVNFGAVIEPTISEDDIPF